MRLDHTRIAIRERSLADILDLALRVIASYPSQWLGYLAVGAVPLLIWNWWLVGWMTGSGDETESIVRYLWNMSALIFIEAPFGSALVTLYFGQAMFSDQPRLRDLLFTLRSCAGNILWCQGFMRGVAPAWLLLWLVPRDSLFTGWETWLILLVLYLALVRAIRPFINEIVLLERNPLRARGDYQITVGRRSNSLHNPNAGDLLARWLGVSLAVVLLLGTLLAATWYLWGRLLMNWNDLTWVLHLLFPLAAWLVVGYVAVVRFLCYLDLRIRREGWEVELVVRSAAAHIVGETA